MSILYTNARIFSGEQVLERGSVVVENGRVSEVTLFQKVSLLPHTEIIGREAAKVCSVCIWKGPTSTLKNAVHTR